MRDLTRWLDNIGFEGLRRALAALSLSLFVPLFLLVSLQPGWGPAFLCMTACYAIAFVAVVAEWFWGRWFAAGLGMFGVMTSVVVVLNVGWIEPIVIFGALHGLVALMLAGKKMAARYDLQEGWRQRYGMDEFGVARLGKTITRSAMALPGTILMALGPKPDESMLTASVAIGALLMLGAGMRGLVLLRSWGWLTVAGSAAVLWTATALSSPAVHFFAAPLTPAFTSDGTVLFTSAFAAALLTLAVLPFLRPALRYLRG